MEKDPGKIPYLQRIRTKQGVKLYFRKGEFRRPLRSADGTDELRNEVAALLAELAQIDKAKTPVPGTLGGMIEGYSRSADFLGLARSTQSEYQRMLDEIAADAGDVLILDVNHGWVAQMRDAWAPRGHRAANLRIQMLINTLRPAMADGRLPKDLFDLVNKVKRPHGTPEPNPVWEDAEVEALIALAIERKMPGLARAIGLGRWGGFRRGTICAIPAQARTIGYDSDGDAFRRLHWLTEKRQVMCDKPEDPRLTALLDSTPNKAVTIAYNRRAGRWKERTLNQAVDRLIEALADQDKMRPVLTLHGLRHSRGVELAEAGASDSEIMSQLEHTSERAARLYRRQARRRRLAVSAQAKVDAALSIRRRPRPHDDQN